jgi:hypothetical protein
LLEHAEALVLGRHAQEVEQALAEDFGAAARTVDHADADALVGFREALEVAPCRLVRLQRLQNVLRDDEWFIQRITGRCEAGGFIRP